jgi:hypothetical protein
MGVSCVALVGGRRDVRTGGESFFYYFGERAELSVPY